MSSAVKAYNDSMLTCLKVVMLCHLKVAGTAYK